MNQLVYDSYFILTALVCTPNGDENIPSTITNDTVVVPVGDGQFVVASDCISSTNIQVSTVGDGWLAAASDGIGARNIPVTTVTASSDGISANSITFAASGGTAPTISMTSTISHLINWIRDIPQTKNGSNNTVEVIYALSSIYDEYWR